MKITKEVYSYGKILAGIGFFFYHFYLKWKTKNLNSFIQKLIKNYLILMFTFLYFFSLKIYQICKTFFQKSKANKIFKISNKTILNFMKKKIKISKLPPLREILFGNNFIWDILEIPVYLCILKLFTKRRITYVQIKVILSIIFHRIIKRILSYKIITLIKSDFNVVPIENMIFYFLSFYFIIRYLKLKYAKYFRKEKRVFHLLLAIEINIISIQLSHNLIELILCYFQEKHFKKKWIYADETALCGFILVDFLLCNRIRVFNGNFARKKKIFFRLFLLYKLIKFHLHFVHSFVDLRNFTISRDNIYTTLEDPEEEDINKQVEKICVVCREKQETPDFSKKLECNHIVHSKCIQTWLIRQKGCPACTFPIVFYDKELEELVQESSSNGLNSKNPFLGIVGVFLGFGKKLNIHKQIQKKKVDCYSLPSLFPETSDLLFLNFINCEKSMLSDRQKNFQYLFKKVFEKKSNGLKLCSPFFKEYFQMRWIQEKKCNLIEVSIVKNFLSSNESSKNKKNKNDNIKINNNTGSFSCNFKEILDDILYFDFYINPSQRVIDGSKNQKKAKNDLQLNVFFEENNWKNKKLNNEDIIKPSDNFVQNQKKFITAISYFLNMIFCTPNSAFGNKIHSNHDFF